MIIAVDIMFSFVSLFTLRNGTLAVTLFWGSQREASLERAVKFYLSNGERRQLLRGRVVCEFEP